MGHADVRRRIGLRGLWAAALALLWAEVAISAPRPDFSGVWLSNTAQRSTDRLGVALFGARGTEAPGGEPRLREPYLSQYKALEARVEASEKSGKPLFDSETQCRPDGMPKMMRAFLPVQIVQTPSLILVLAEELMQTRRIYINQPLPALDDLTPSYNGYSVGHWEGDTLVIETIGVREEARFLDMPHSAKMKVTERVRLVSPDALEDHITIEDPEVLAQPYVFAWRYRKDKTYKIMEYICDDNHYKADSQGNAEVTMPPTVPGAPAAPTAPTASQAAQGPNRSPMYSYQTIWTLPRARWADMEKAATASGKILDPAIAQGPLIAYGHDANPLHTPDGWTQVDWWAAASITGVLQIADAMARPGSDVLTAATKQTDGLYISHYYNWRPGTYHGLHTYIEIYQLKPEAPADAVDVLSRATLQPLLERLVADKTLVEYEIDEPVFHTEPSRSFFVNYMLQDPENLERVDAALAHALEANSTAADLIDFKTSRGSLSRTRVAVFK